MKWAYLIGIHLIGRALFAQPVCPLVVKAFDHFETEPIVAVGYSGRYLVVAERGGTTAKVYPLSWPLPGNYPQQAAPNSDIIRAAAVSDTRVAISDATGKTEVSTTRGLPLYQIDPLNHVTHQLTFSPGGGVLLAVERGVATLHNADDGSTIRGMGAKNMNQAIYLPNILRIGAIGTDGRSHVFNVWDMQESPEYKVVPPKLLDRGPEPLVTLSAPPRAPLFATGGTEGGVNLWNARTGENLFQQKSGTGPITALNFSLEGERLLSTNQEGFGQVWNTKTGGSPVVIPAEKYGPITDGYLIRNGAYALTSHGDGGVRIWELDSPGGGRRHSTLLYEWRLLTGEPISHLKMLPDSRFLVVGSRGSLYTGEIPRIPSR